MSCWNLTCWYQAIDSTLSTVNLIIKKSLKKVYLINIWVQTLCCSTNWLFSSSVWNPFSFPCIILIFNLGIYNALCNHVAALWRRVYYGVYLICLWFVGSHVEMASVSTVGVESKLYDRYFDKLCFRQRRNHHSRTLQKIPNSPKTG